MLIIHVWLGPRGTWLATCPVLQSGTTGPTRDEAVAELRKNLHRELMETFGAHLVKVVDGPPEQEELA